MDRLSASREQYLLTLYLMDLDAEGVRLTDLSEAMTVTMSSAYAAVKDLENLGYAVKSSNRVIYLTEQGQQEAARINDRRETIVRFMTEVLGLAEWQILDEAGAMEHILSEESYQAMAELVMSA